MKISPQSWYKALLQEFEKQLQTIPEGEHPQAWWTTFWKAVMNNLSKELGYEMKSEKPQRVDYSFYEHGFYDPLAAVEVEWNEKSVEKELINLISIDCLLKVLITYSTWNEFWQNARKVWDILSKRKRTKNKDFLIIFWLYELEYGNKHFRNDFPFHHGLLAITREDDKLKLFWQAKSRLFSRYYTVTKRPKMLAP